MSVKVKAKEMIKWVNVKEKPFPKDGENYLALFKGQFCLLTWDEDKERHIMAWMPNSYDHVWELAPERERKITHWAKLVLPEDY